MLFVRVFVCSPVVCFVLSVVSLLVVVCSLLVVCAVCCLLFVCVFVCVFVYVCVLLFVVVVCCCLLFAVVVSTFCKTSGMAGTTNWTCKVPYEIQCSIVSCI